jgi:transposase
MRFQLQQSLTGLESLQDEFDSIAGAGPLTAVSMMACFHSREFRHADAFIAFLGMDVRVRESGQFRGRRTLTKRGDPKLRRLLFTAAMQG